MSTACDRKLASLRTRRWRQRHGSWGANCPSPPSTCPGPYGVDSPSPRCLDLRAYTDDVNKCKQSTTIARHPWKIISKDRQPRAANTERLAVSYHSTADQRSTTIGHVSIAARLTGQTGQRTGESKVQCLASGRGFSPGGLWPPGPGRALQRTDSRYFTGSPSLQRDSALGDDHE